MVKDILIVVTFLTRIPIKINFVFGEEELGRTSRYFPLVGFLIGMLVALILYLFSGIHVQLASALAILTGILLTGGLHLDGLMDTTDGIFSARSRERMLEIMKDSRVGAHGVTGAVIILLLKFVLYQMVVDAHGIFWIVPMAFVFSRWIMVYTILYFPGARSEGLGQIYKKFQRRSDFPIATGLTLLPLVIFQDWFTLVPIVVSLGMVWLCCRSIQKALGGLTGDVYGAMAELSEVLFILSYLVLQAVT